MVAEKVVHSPIKHRKFSEHVSECLLRVRDCFPAPGEETVESEVVESHLRYFVNQVGLKASLVSGLINFMIPYQCLVREY